MQTKTIPLHSLRELVAWIHLTLYTHFFDGKLISFHFLYVRNQKNIALKPFLSGIRIDAISPSQNWTSHLVRTLLFTFQMIGLLI